MNSSAALFRVKEGKLAEWRAWLLRLGGDLRGEALETLAEEGNNLEIFASFEVDGSPYVLAISRGECRPATARKVNEDHRASHRACLEYVGPATVDLDLYR